MAHGPTFQLQRFIGMTGSLRGFIDLDRTFREMSRDELESLGDEAVLHSGIGKHLKWDEVLRFRRVVLLAEGGSGKTREMQELTARLAKAGEFAFFLPLESLASRSVSGTLGPEELTAFNRWRESEDRDASFFLDSRDELTLTQQRFDSALISFAHSIEGKLHRARIVVSSRPHDWAAGFDLATFESQLPAAPVGRPRTQSADEAFLRVLSAEHRRPPFPKNDAEAETNESDGCKIVHLLPLNRKQIASFVECAGASDPRAFIGEVERQNAWNFAARPLDLNNLLATWENSKRLGTRREQHENNLKLKLMEVDPRRAEMAVLSEIEAREGAERIALAITLTHKQTILSPDHQLRALDQNNILDPAEVLPEWTPAKRNDLLRRALFEPATYGRLRLPRPVQEFLAARRLQTLKSRGMTSKGLRGLIFAEQYGVEVVIPSMKPIAAWLAVSDQDVFREILRREPEALLSSGDPESLPLEWRRDLLGALVDVYGAGGWRGIQAPGEELRRLARPELGPTIKKLLETAKNAEIRELLLELIAYGPIPVCVDLAKSVAFDAAAPPYHRILAAEALIACKKRQDVLALAREMVSRPERWPERVVRGLAAKLFPQFVTVAELRAFIERCPEPDNLMGGFRWSARQIAENVNPDSPEAGALTGMLTDLIFDGRNSERTHPLSSRYGFLAPALAILCTRRLEALPRAADAQLVRACVIAARFGRHEEEFKRLKAVITEMAVSRSALFWAELEIADSITTHTDDISRLNHAQIDGQIALSQADEPWLVAELRNETMMARRPVALCALIGLWRQRDADPEGLAELRASIGASAALHALLEKYSALPEPNEKLERYHRHEPRRRCVAAAREAERVEGWKKWRDEAVANSSAAFAPERRESTISNLYAWLQGASEGAPRSCLWHRGKVVDAFSSQFADEAERAFSEYWRASRPILWSRREPDGRNSVLYRWVFGLCGAAADATKPNWAEHLTADDARTAAALATIEINGLPAFTAQLIRAHSTIVESVFGEELSAELAVAGDHAHLDVLHHVQYAGDDLKRLMAPRLRQALTKFNKSVTAENSERLSQHLANVLSILDAATAGKHRSQIAKRCAAEYQENPDGPLSAQWLRGVFLFDAEHGAKILAILLAAAEPDKVGSRAEKLFATVFGEHGGQMLAISDPGARARALSALIRGVYKHVRPSNDREHKGVYTPDDRDRAERARSWLLNTLIEMPGPAARRELIALSSDPGFAHMADRLRLLARSRAAADAEPKPTAARSVAELDRRNEVPPANRDSLFLVMLDRLEDLDHDLEHHDFSDRRTLRDISQETDMQRTLAMRLYDRANGAYVLSREEEVADSKRTDIRFSALGVGVRAVAEVKIADNWTIKDLEGALRVQLVGQYLRHEDCKAGCLLLIYRGKKGKWKRPRSAQRLSFREAVAYLASKAKNLEGRSNGQLRVAVVGIDLNGEAACRGPRKTTRYRKR